VSYLDSSFLIDYVDGDEAATVEYLENHPNDRFLVSTLSLYELCLGAALSGTSDDRMDAIRRGIHWADIDPFEESDAVEAARIRGELSETGEQINLADVLIAGAAREAGEAVVTRDRDFDAIDGLETERY
jgi:predicted nucleic acid-binding protein